MTKYILPVFALLLSLLSFTQRSAAEEQLTNRGPVICGDVGCGASGMAATNGLVYFMATQDGKQSVWRSDGTPEGTFSIEALGAGGSSPLIHKMAAGEDGCTYFYTRNTAGGFSFSTIHNVVRSNGTKAGTSIIHSYFGGWLEDPTCSFVSANGSVYFIDYASKQLMKCTNGIVSSVGSWGRMNRLFSTNKKIYFVVDTSSSPTAIDGLYQLDGTGTRRISSFEPQTLLGVGSKLFISPGLTILDPATGASTSHSASPNQMVEFNGRVFFTDKKTTPERLMMAAADDSASTVSLVSSLDFGQYDGAKALLTPTADALFVFCADATHGRELWKLDASLNFSLVKDLCPGPDHYVPIAMASFSSGVVFLVQDNAGHRVLWKSDGTEAGTQIIKDIGLATAAGGEIAVTGNKAFFTGDGDTGREVWSSNGTASGTSLAGNIGVTTSTLTTSNNSFAANNEIFFTGADGYLSHLYRMSDPAAGPQEIGTLLNPTAKIDARYIAGISAAASVAEGVYFLFSGSSSGYDRMLMLYFYDYNLKSLRYLTSFHYSNAQSSPPYYLTTIGNDAYLFLGNMLWRYTAATGSSKQIASSAVEPYCVGLLGNKLYYGTKDSGEYLWKTDGTDAGTKQVGPCDARPSSWSSIRAESCVISNCLVFSAKATDTGKELWKTNGNAAGTHIIKDINPGSTNSDPGSFTVLNGKAVFAATSAATGRELYCTDSSAVGTVLLKDINTGTASSAPMMYTVFQNAAYFSATSLEAGGTALWKTDGTAQGTKVVKTIATGALWTTTPGRMFFLNSNTSGGHDLIASDGTTSNTIIVNSFVKPLYTYGPVPKVQAIGNTIYFAADDGVHGSELWRSDGTVQGTAMVADLLPGSSRSSPVLLGTVGRVLVFTARNSSGVTEFWSCDNMQKSKVRRWSGYQ